MVLRCILRNYASLLIRIAISQISKYILVFINYCNSECMRSSLDAKAYHALKSEDCIFKIDYFLERFLVLFALALASLNLCSISCLMFSNVLFNAFFRSHSDSCAASIMLGASSFVCIEYLHFMFSDGFLACFFTVIRSFGSGFEDA